MLFNTKRRYAPLHLRMALVPITQIATFAWQGIFLLGIFWDVWQVTGHCSLDFHHIGVFSARDFAGGIRRQPPGKGCLVELGWFEGKNVGVSKVLNAAALTYVPLW